MKMKLKLSTVQTPGKVPTNPLNFRTYLSYAIIRFLTFITSYLNPDNTICTPPLAYVPSSARSVHVVDA